MEASYFMCESVNSYNSFWKLYHLFDMIIHVCCKPKVPFVLVKAQKNLCIRFTWVSVVTQTILSQNGKCSMQFNRRKHIHVVCSCCMFMFSTQYWEWLITINRKMLCGMFSDLMALRIISDYRQLLRRMSH